MLIDKRIIQYKIASEAGLPMEEKCKTCGQPKPEIMPCDEWIKAGEDLVRQVMQPGGLLKAGNLGLFSLRKKHWYSNRVWIKTDCITGEQFESDKYGRIL